MLSIHNLKPTLGELEYERGTSAHTLNAGQGHERMRLRFTRFRAQGVEDREGVP